VNRFIVLLLVILLLLVTWSILFTVHETQSAIVTRFGDPVRVIEEPGLRVKYPWPIELVVYFDNRLLTLDKPGPDEPPKELLTLDKKNIEVTSYTCWKIEDPLRFLEACGGRPEAEAALGDIVYSELGRLLGRHDLSTLLSTETEERKLDEITEQIRSTCADQASREYGVQIVEFRIKRIVFPEQNRNPVFDRMRAERKRIATRYRSEGEEEAAKIRAQADKECTETRAHAQRTAREIQGRAEAEATGTYAEAFGQDPEFYEFLRTLESYRTSLSGKTRIILDADSPYLQLLKSGAAGPIRGTSDASD
jgi:membrane protease subunit HflC